MKKSIVVTFGCLSLVCSSFALAAESLEAIPQDEAQKFGASMAKAASKIENPQITIDGDAKKANGAHVPDAVGVLVVPQKDLVESEEYAAKFKEEKGAALAYMFAYHLVPVIDGQTVDASKLRTISIYDDDGNEVEINVLLLAVRQVSEGDYRLYAYGTGDEPLVDAKFSEGTGPGAEPVAVEVINVDENERQGDTVVTVFGKYQAQFRIGHAE